MEFFARKKRIFRAVINNASRGTLIALLGAIFVAAPVSSDGRDFVVPDQIKNEIQEILEKPKQVYRIDLKKDNATNYHVDQFFGRYFHFEKAEPVTRKKGAPSTFRLPMAESTPIRWNGKGKESDRVQPKGFVWYTKQPHKRSFLKELDIPTKKVLEEGRAITVALSFITENKLATVTKTDTLKSTGVLVRKKQELKPDGTIGEVLVLSQRVSFMRQIDGLPVLNAKQILSLHPDSEEIIGYKRIYWTEIFSQGDSLPYRSKDEILSEIQAQLSTAEAGYTIEKVVPAMYQTSDRILPVLAVHTLKRVRDEKARPIQEAFLVGLVKGFEGGQPAGPKDKRRPSRAVKR